MARLTKVDSIYRMSLHKNGGYMYATTHPYTVTEDGKRKYSCLHWGTVTDELKFIPGKQCLYASPEERAKLIFPEGWDLSERYSKAIAGKAVQHTSAQTSIVSMATSGSLSGSQTR